MPHLPPEAIAFSWYLAALIYLPLVIFLLRRGKPWVPRDTIIVLTMAMQMLGGLVFLLELVAGISESWLFCGTVIAIAGALYAMLFGIRWWRAGAGFWAIWAVGIIALHFLEISPAKPFLRFYGAIEDGMTSTEVIAILHREFPPAGRNPLPVDLSAADQTWMSFFFDPRQGADGAEEIVVTLRHGRVVGKGYVPD